MFELVAQVYVVYGKDRATTRQIEKEQYICLIVLSVLQAS